MPAGNCANRDGSVVALVVIATRGLPTRELKRRRSGVIAPMDTIIDFINLNRDRYLDELKALLAIPSISALPEHTGDVRRCAEWCGEEMRRIGLEHVQLIETPGNPVVYGDWLGAPGAPTILFYGHYDVQPVDPLNLWESPPFEADDS